MFVLLAASAMDFR